MGMSIKQYLEKLKNSQESKEYPYLSIVLENGVTLYGECHKKVHKECNFSGRITGNA